jgi:Cys-tRNA(Pro)/Cys-tRNA(Cys) deacylase
MVKTNAIRRIEAKKIKYKLYEYSAPQGFLDGVHVAMEIGISPEKVYKTLVTQGSSKEYYVCVIPVAMELDLKLAAKVLNEKKLEMIPANTITEVTGYIKGGCSPIGMRKQFRTVIDLSAKSQETILVSAGKVGLQVEIDAEALREITGAQFVKII